MKKLVLAALIASLHVSNVSAESFKSCYPSSMPAQPIPLVTVLLIDESSAPETVTLRDFKKAVNDSINRPQHLFLLAYAGLAAGESLRVVNQWYLEPALNKASPEYQSTVFKQFKDSQACVVKQYQKAQTEISANLDAVLSKMPIKTKRSEIAYALATVVKDFAHQGMSTQIFHLSDGIQYGGPTGRNFYAKNGQPRKIDPLIEAKAIGKEGFTLAQSKPAKGGVSVLWWGMLSVPKTSKDNYLDPNMVNGYKIFWSSMLESWGASKVQIGVPSLINPDLSVPSSLGPL
jgi:hypothetical protein